VTRAELLSARVTRAEIEHRLGAGSLIRVYPGVYRVGHAAPSTEAAYMAAVKACGPGAVLSGRAAAHIHCLIKSRRPPAPEVTAPTERRVEGLKTRRCRSLHRRDKTLARGIPVTTVPRTIVDLAAELELDDLARACHEAGVRHRTTPRQVEAALARRPNVPGATNLHLVTGRKVPVALSKLEKRFHALLEEAHLPLPVTNRPAGGRRVDCRWSEPPLTVELDSYTFHNSRQAWEEDNRRAREARRRGDEFRRYTYLDVFEDPSDMLRELRELLTGEA
jgi:hypothetical protein